MPAIADTSLSSEERRLLERFVSELEQMLGDDLAAVWLYGSRARGEPGGPESDVDLLVLVADASWDGRDRVHDTLRRVAGELGLEALPWNFSVHIQTPEWLRGRREIESFFIREVDRDKVVLYGQL